MGYKICVAINKKFIIVYYLNGLPSNILRLHSYCFNPFSRSFDAIFNDSDLLSDTGCPSFNQIISGFGSAVNVTVSATLSPFFILISRNPLFEISKGFRYSATPIFYFRKYQIITNFAFRMK